MAITSLGAMGTYTSNATSRSDSPENDTTRRGTEPPLNFLNELVAIPPKSSTGDDGDEERAEPPVAARFAEEERISPAER